MFDQAEIDALLSSVEAQYAPQADGAIQIFSRHRRDSEPIEIREYDFRRPERIGKDQLRALESLHEAFARNLGSALTSFLRSIVEVSLSHVEQMTYAEFIAGLPNPTSFTLIESPAVEGPLGLELSPLIIYPIIDRLLGGSGSELYIPQRPLSAIETRLVRQILARVAACLSEAWKDLTQATFAPGDMETNPHLAQFVPPNEVVVAARFELRFAKRSGGMALCIPSRVFEGLQGALQARSRVRGGGAAQPGAGGPWQPAIAARLGDVAVDVRVVVAETTMTVEELQRLEVGDVIASSHEASQPLTVCIEGRPKFRATMGQHRARKAVQIV